MFFQEKFKNQAFVDWNNVGMGDLAQHLIYT
jgi:hypothetical protein